MDCESQNELQTRLGTGLPYPTPKSLYASWRQLWFLLDAVEGLG